MDNAFVFFPFDSEKQIFVQSLGWQKTLHYPESSAIIWDYTMCLAWQTPWSVSSSVIGWRPTAFHMKKKVLWKIKSNFIQQCLLYSLKVITWMHCNKWFGCIKYYTSVIVLYLSTEIGHQNRPETIIVPFCFNFTIKLVVIICFDIIVNYYYYY